MPVWEVVLRHRAQTPNHCICIPWVAVKNVDIELSEEDFAQWLRRQLRARKPTAVVRFSGGEGKLLMADPDGGESMAVAARKLENETGRAFSAAEVLEVKGMVKYAFDRADVLGMRFDEGLLDAHKEWTKRLASIYCEARAEGRPPAGLAHPMLNYQILASLPEMLAGRRVSVITCRDVRPVLENEWGLDDLVVYQVPSEHKVRRVDGEYECALHDVPIWPDVHARVSAELAVRERAEVFLIGAGVFGKDLCIQVRDEGGIALDMGSALDQVVGRITRGPEWRILDLHARGTPVGEIAAILEQFYKTPVQSSEIADVIRGARLSSR